MLGGLGEIKTPLTLGIIGMVEGNGHPFSWSAIFNGYEDKLISQSGFPLIADYLSKKKFPDDAIRCGSVDFIWTQDEFLSERIAKTCKIRHVVRGDLSEMKGHVDAVLLARDDSANHRKHAEVFLESGIPVYIDKPVALSVSEATVLLALAREEWQLFTTSALRYSPKLISFAGVSIGLLSDVSIIIRGSWEKYAIHCAEILEVLLNLSSHAVERIDVNRTESSCAVKYRTDTNLTFSILCDESHALGPTVVMQFITGEVQSVVIDDYFEAFKNALKGFLRQIETKQLLIPRRSTLSVVSVVEMGMPE